MSKYLLIHGASHGGWCWEKIKTQLESMGHQVIAPDLPGHSIPLEIKPAKITLETYISFITRILFDSKDKVILVGHSMGGAVITGAAEIAFSTIEQIIYVCAYVPRHGERIHDLLQADKGSKLKFKINEKDMQAEPAVIEDIINAIYNGCSEEDITFASSRLVPEPLIPVMTPIVLPQEKFKSVERIGIVCTEDQAITPEYQKKMYEEAGCKIRTLNSGHSPFFSKASELTQILSN